MKKRNNYQYKILHCVLYFLLLTVFSCQSQPKLEKARSNNTLLWQVSGKQLKEPVYFLGTMHILCPEDAKLSPSVNQVLQRVKQIYFEVDLDDLAQMFGLLKTMNMQNDTRLKDLLTPEEYEKVKAYFEKKVPLPFSMMENYKPMLLSSMIAEQTMPCKATNGMELIIMEQANKQKLDIKGLETMDYQAGLFDSIPYIEQAKELVKAIDSADSQEGTVDSMLHAYRSQDLEALWRLTVSEEAGMDKYLDLLLYTRNRNWVAQFDTIAVKGPTLFAVGAGHLPGEHGVLNLLRKKGYTLTPLKN